LGAQRRQPSRDIQFGSKTSEYFRANIQFPFFERYLKGKGERNLKQSSLRREPTSGAGSTHGHLRLLRPRLSSSMPEANSALIRRRKLRVQMSTLAIRITRCLLGYTTDTVPQRYMVDDQRFASYRPDVLVYETDPLQEDVTIAGPISPKLKIASSATDSDFDVKLIDVFPEDYPDPDDMSHGNKRILDAPPTHMGAYEELLRGEPFRAKFRNSWEKPEPLAPAKRRTSTSPCRICSTLSVAAIAS